MKLEQAILIRRLIYFLIFLIDKFLWKPEFFYFIFIYGLMIDTKGYGKGIRLLITSRYHWKSLKSSNHRQWGFVIHEYFQHSTKQDKKISTRCHTLTIPKWQYPRYWHHCKSRVMEKNPRPNKVSSLKRFISSTLPWER